MMNNFIGTSLSFRCFLQRKTKSYPGRLYKKNDRTIRSFFSKLSILPGLSFSDSTGQNSFFSQPF